MGSIIGWDVGGAHLKVARAEAGASSRSFRGPRPLWLGLDRSTHAFEAAAARRGRANGHVATMTGELADIFQTRPQGVAGIAAMLAGKLG